MGYYTRVISQRLECPPFGELTRAIATYPNILLSGEHDAGGPWDTLLLSHSDGEAIASIERNLVLSGSLAQEEIAEFIDEIQGCEPANALPWLTSFLNSAKVIFAFQHLSGSSHHGGEPAIRLITAAIWKYGGAILQADGEGFSNAEGYHILWQFPEDASGPWAMAVRQHSGWACFQMDLGNRDHRQAYLDGRVPLGVNVAATFD
jgi:hypothetical protein